MGIKYKRKIEQGNYAVCRYLLRVTMRKYWRNRENRVPGSLYRWK